MLKTLLALKGLVVRMKQRGRQCKAVVFSQGARDWRMCRIRAYVGDYCVRHVDRSGNDEASGDS